LDLEENKAMRAPTERIRRAFAARATAVAAVATLVLAVSWCGGRVDLKEGTGSGAFGADLGAAASDSNGGSGGATSGGSDSGVDASLGIAPGTTGSTKPAGRSPSVAGTACWDNQLPAQVQPIAPTAPVAMTCSVALGYSQWVNFVGGDAGDGDVRSHFVGRWATCGGSGALNPLPHAGVEFGANGRWRLLVADSTGALVPATSTDGSTAGHYYALASGQLDLTDDTMQGSQIFFAKVSTGADAVEFEKSGVGDSGGSSIYARATPSPANGNDNPPSTSNGACSMVGTWDVGGSATSSSGTFSFDEAGNFVGAGGGDLCTSHTMYGTYALIPGMFWLTENVNMGLCAWWFDAGYPTTFDASCTHLTITQHFDNCTGGRNYFNGTTTLTKRP
jgi:hypothetical protein